MNPKPQDLTQLAGPMEKIDFPLIVRKFRWRHACSLVGCLAALGIAAYFQPAHESTWFTWTLVVLFGGGAFIYLSLLTHSKPSLIISENGICAAHWGIGVIPWDTLRSAYIKTDNGIDYICLTLSHPEEYRRQIGKFGQVLNSANRATGFSDFTVNPSAMGLDTTAVFELVKEQIDLAKTNPKPTGPSFKYHTG